MAKKNIGLKLSVDLTDENRETLENLKERKRISCGKIINDAVAAFCKLPFELKRELCIFIDTSIEVKKRELGTASACRKAELSEQIAAYRRIFSFLEGEEMLSVDTTPTTGLTKYLIKDGYLICPEDWIVVNPEAAGESMYACILECRNSDVFGREHFGMSIPHFICYTDVKYGRDYSSEFFDYYNRLCVQAWPNFQKVIESQVKPVNDPAKNGRILNEDEWISAPAIGQFAVYENGDTVYPRDYNPPYGAMIVRTRR